LIWPLPLPAAHRARPASLSHIDCSVDSNIDARQQHLRDGLVDACWREQALLATTTELVPATAPTESSALGSIAFKPFYTTSMPLNSSATAVEYLPFPAKPRGACGGVEGAAARARVAAERVGWRELRGHGAPARAHLRRHGGGREGRQQQRRARG